MNDTTRQSAPLPALPGRRRKRTLVRDILLTQLSYAAIIGLTASISVWSISSWVVQDNLDNWSTRWVAELDTLGSGFFLKDEQERSLQIESFIALFPEIAYVRYYDANGAVIYTGARHDANPIRDPLRHDELIDLQASIEDGEEYSMDTSVTPLVRIMMPYATEAIASGDLWEAASLEEMSTHRTVTGYMEVVLDYGKYDRALVSGTSRGMIVVALAFLMLTLLGRVALRRAVQPLSALQSPLERIAEGDLDVHVGESLHQEVSAIGNAINTAVARIRERDQRLQRLALFDNLTGLPNRHHFMSTLEAALRDRTTALRGAVLLIDLDQFKYVNDSVGHLAGDVVLTHASDRLKRAMRAGDLLARFGGDEFAAFLPSADADEAARIAARCMEDLSGFPLVSNRQSFNMKCSIGLALITPDRVHAATEYLAQADFACHRAKAQGRNCMVRFEPERDGLDSVRVDVGWQRKLESALKNDGFVLHFQPIMHVATREVGHYEVLLRLTDGDALHYPNAFLPAAERFGMMRDIDRWVIEHALRALAEHRRADPALCFSVNVSGHSLAGSDLFDWVAAGLEANGLPAQSLLIEITEQAAIGSMSEASRQIDALIDLGVQIAIDDFGSGYSSLSYLKRLRMQFIKIDGSFIRKLVTSEFDQTIVRAVADLARVTGKRTIAEFVGDEATLKALRKLGIDYAQGFLIGKPAATLLTPNAKANARVRLVRA